MERSIWPVSSPGSVLTKLNQNKPAGGEKWINLSNIYDVTLKLFTTVLHYLLVFLKCFINFLFEFKARRMVNGSIDRADKYVEKARHVWQRERYFARNNVPALNKCCVLAMINILSFNIYISRFSFKIFVSNFVFLVLTLGKHLRQVWMGYKKCSNC